MARVSCYYILHLIYKCELESICSDCQKGM